LELQKDAKPIDLGKVCEYPTLKTVSYLMHIYDVSFDTIDALAKELGINNDCLIDCSKKRIINATPKR